MILVITFRVIKTTTSIIGKYGKGKKTIILKKNWGTKTKKLKTWFYFLVTNLFKKKESVKTEPRTFDKNDRKKSLKKK